MLADIKRDLSTALGILDPNEGGAQRATFIVDPENVIPFVLVNDLSVGGNPNEVLRVLVHAAGPRAKRLSPRRKANSNEPDT